MDEAVRYAADEGTITLPEGLTLEHGGTLAGAQVAYRLAGAPGAPVVGVLGGISAHRHVSSEGANEDEGSGSGPGWWEWMVGVGRPLDLAHCRVLTFDYAVAPLITTADQASVLYALIEALDLGPVEALVGSSYGGAVALAFAADQPESLRRAMIIGAADEGHPLAIAIRVVQRRIVRQAVEAGRPEEGLALARALAMTTYRSDVEYAERFSGPPTIGPDGVRFPVEDYIDHHGRAFARRFSVDHFLALSQSMDLHYVDVAKIRAPMTLVSVDPDLIAPRWQMEDLARKLGEGHELVRIDSVQGHDAFLTDQETFSRIMTDFSRAWV